jgi:ribosomal protein S27AE
MFLGCIISIREGMRISAEWIAKNQKVLERKEVKMNVLQNYYENGRNIIRRIRRTCPLCVFAVLLPSGERNLER